MKKAECSVTYVDHMGSDLSVVNAARQSFDKQKTEYEPAKDGGLISYLATGKRTKEWDSFLDEITELSYQACSCNDEEWAKTARENLKQRLIAYKREAQHFAPFAHPHVELRLRMPIFLARQFVKHCVTGDTLVTFEKTVKGGSNGVSRRSIKHLYDMWTGKIKYQGGEKGKRNVSNGHVRVFNESSGLFETSHISDVIYQGKKQVFRVVVESGQELRATTNHKVMTQRGWITVGELTRDDFMVTEVGQGALVNPKKQPRWNDWEDKKARRSVDKNECAICGSSDNLEADHIVPVVLGGSHDASNMQCLCSDCHKEKTALEKMDSIARNQYDPRYVRVVSIIEEGEEDVYDITVEGIHNFMANGLVVHNCVGGVWSEESRRYISDEPEFFFEPVLMARPDDIKQGASGELQGTQEENARGLIEAVTMDALGAYLDLMNDYQLAPEQAREILPLNMMTGVTWTGSLLFWSRVVNQRVDGHAQGAAQNLAKKISDILQPLYPVSWKALTGI